MSLKHTKDRELKIDMKIKEKTKVDGMKL